MDVTVKRSILNGTVIVPASKSHTIRAIIIAALAHGKSVIRGPLDSLDTRSAAAAARAFGAHIEMSGEHWTVKGVGGAPVIPEDVINVGNSGTTLYFSMGTAALVDGWTVITGDDQIRRRSATPLINALGPLGAEVFSSRGNGLAPILIRGRMTGGMASISGISSQYVSSLLLACPLAAGDTELIVTVLNERPYVQMTLNWLAGQGIVPKVSGDMSTIRIKGGQSYTAFEKHVPADFSSAAFPLCAGVLAGGTVVLKGLEMNDPQGDKEIIYILQRMGAVIEMNHNTITVHGASLRGIDVDMNSIPDALPIMAVCACFAEGTTVLHNVPQARIKETDRISVMAKELRKLGADINELPDGLIIKGKGLKGGKVHGHGDHRVVMALTVAGFAADGPVTVDTAETASVTYPGFWDIMKSLGGSMQLDK
ncbi:MAG: 3-phosphoshikimate 1-carboxyvinyltransferase [Candidatus Latescibacterota bacterium]